MKKMLNEYDITKGMLNTLRTINEGIGERDPNDKDEVTMVGDVEVRMMSNDDNDMFLEEDQKSQISEIIENFKSQVSDLTEFIPGFTITPNNIRLDARIPGVDLKFVLIAGKDAGLYFNCEMLRVNDDSLNMIEKLVKFDNTFSSSLDDIISDRKLN